MTAHALSFRIVRGRRPRLQQTVVLIHIDPDNFMRVLLSTIGTAHAPGAPIAEFLMETLRRTLHRGCCSARTDRRSLAGRTMISLSGTAIPIHGGWSVI
jgi:hypothetical protein